jgi:hypothetical protein
LQKAHDEQEVDLPSLNGTLGALRRPRVSFLQQLRIFSLDRRYSSPPRLSFHQISYPAAIRAETLRFLRQLVRKPAIANTNPGNPATTTGPGTAAGVWPESEKAKWL